MNGKENLYFVPNGNVHYEKFKDIDNLNLLFNKFLRWKEGNNKEFKDNRRELFNNIIKLSNKLLMNEIVQRNKNIIDKLNHAYWDSESFEMISDWRLVVGLGAHHPYETSMTLEHLYGVPIIPGSSLKGVFRAYCIYKAVNMDISKVDNVDKEIEEMEEKKILEIFKNFKDNGWDSLSETEKILILVGNQSYAWNLIFLDAVPVEKLKFKKDIMTPHFANYYSGKSYPNDTESPVPIQFLTIEHAKFRFSYILDKKRLIRDIDKIKNYVKTNLKEALELFGVGAKTLIGYGHFK